MSVSFLRSRTGDVLFFFLQKNSLTDLKAYVRRSTDDARTWGTPTLVTADPGYHVMNNARVIQLRSGRLLAPVASSKQVWTKNDDFRTSVYLSDDDGRTWRAGSIISKSRSVIMLESYPRSRPYLSSSPPAYPPTLAC